MNRGGFNRWTCAAIPAFAFLFASLGATAQAPAAGEAAKQEHPAEQIDAYVALIQADQARDRGNWKTAIQQYREAMKQYALLVERNPNWNPEIVQFRLSYCANEVQAILKKTGKSEAELLAGPAITAEDENASYKERFDALKRDHEKAREEAAQLRKDSAMNEAVAKNLQVEAKRLEKDNNRLRLELTAAENLANRNAAEVEQRKQDIGHLMTRIDGLQAQIQKADRDRQSAERSKAEAEQTGVELSRALADARKTNDALQAGTLALTQQLDEARKTLADQQTRLMAASNELVKAAAANEKLVAEIKASGKVDAEKFKKQYEVARAEADLLAKKLSAAETAANERGAQIATLARERKDLTNDLSAVQAEAGALKREIDAAKEEIRRQQKAVLLATEATNTVAKQKAEMVKLEQTVAAAEKARKDAESLAAGAARIQAKLDDANKEMAERKGELAKLEQSLAAAVKARKDAEDLAGNAARLKTGLDEANGLLAAQKAQLSQLQKDLAAARDLIDTQGRETAKFRAAYEEATVAKAQLERDARLAADSLARLTRENKDMSGQLKGGDAAAKAAAEASVELKKSRDQLVASQNEVMSLRQQLAAAAAQKPPTEAGKVQRDLLTAQAEIVQLKQQLAAGAPAVAPAAEVEQLRKELAAARDEARTWAARQESMSNNLDGVRKRLAELNQEMLTRDKKAQSDATELDAARRDLTAAKTALAQEQKRAADLDEKQRTAESTRTAEVEKLRKHAAALGETVDLNQKELLRLRDEIKGARDRVEQLENENRLLQNENVRLKK